MEGQTDGQLQERRIISFVIVPVSCRVALSVGLDESPFSRGRSHVGLSVWRPAGGSDMLECLLRG